MTEPTTSVYHSMKQNQANTIYMYEQAGNEIDMLQAIGQRKQTIQF